MKACISKHKFDIRLFQVRNPSLIQVIQVINLIDNKQKIKLNFTIFIILLVIKIIDLSHKKIYKFEIIGGKSVYWLLLFEIDGL